MCFKHFHKDLFVALSFIPSPLPLIYFREANRLLFPEVLQWKTAFLKPALHPRFLSRLSSDCITKNSRRITSIEVSNNVQAFFKKWHTFEIVNSVKKNNPILFLSTCYFSWKVQIGHLKLASKLFLTSISDWWWISKCFKY